MIIVFYDGKCGLCTKEINYYKEIAPPNVFDWQDITQDALLLEQEGIALSEGLKIIHVKNSHGAIKKGVDGFITIWQELPNWSILAKVVNTPIIKQLTNIAYLAFAKWRFKRLAHCQLASKDDKK